MGKVKVGLVQMSCVKDAQPNLDKAIAGIRDAAKNAGALARPPPAPSSVRSRRTQSRARRAGKDWVSCGPGLSRAPRIQAPDWGRWFAKTNKPMALAARPLGSSDRTSLQRPRRAAGCLGLVAVGG